MPRKFCCTGRMRARCTVRSCSWTESADRDAIIFDVGGKFETDLPPSGQFDIDLRQQFGIEQRAVFHPVAAIDTVAAAQGLSLIHI